MNVPGFQIATATHDFLSNFDFRQATFENTFSLNDGCRDYIAVATMNDLILISATLENGLPASLLNDGPPGYRHNKKANFPKNASLSFFNMSYDGLFKLNQMKTIPKFKEIMLFRTSGSHIIALPSDDFASCIHVPRGVFVPLR